MATFQQSQGQTQRAIPLQKIIEFQKLLKADNQGLMQLMKQRIGNNLFVDSIDAPVKMESLPDFGIDGDKIYEGKLYENVNDTLGIKSQSDGNSFQDIPEDRKFNMRQRESKEGDLVKQLDRLSLSDEEFKVAHTLIYSLDSNGFLSEDAKTIGLMTYLSLKSGLPDIDYVQAKNLVVTESALVIPFEQFLTKLKNELEPVGVLANGPIESLTLQVNKSPDYNRALKRTVTDMVENHLEEVLKLDLEALRLKLNQKNFFDIQRAYDVVLSLNPYPLLIQSEGSGVKSYNQPEFLLKHDLKAEEKLQNLNREREANKISDSQFEELKSGIISFPVVALADTHPQVRFNKDYELMFNNLSKDSDFRKENYSTYRDTRNELVARMEAYTGNELNALDQELRKGYQSDRQALQSLDSKHPVFAQYFLLEKEKAGVDAMMDDLKNRQRLIEKVLTLVASKQSEFLIGNNADTLKELTMKEIAQTLNLSSGTVSSIISNKVLVNESGEVFTMRQLFNLGVKNKSGESLAINELRSDLRTRIETENPKSPMTDIELVKTYKEKGFHISSSRIAKMRESLGVEDAQTRLRQYKFNEQTAQRNSQS